MEIYFLKAAACLAILMLFYKLLLERENMHVFKRFYLLTAPVISFAIPAITFPEYVVVSSESITSFDVTASPSEASRFPIFQAIIGGIYVLGVLFFGSRFFLNLRSLLKRAKTNPKVKINGAVQVLVKEDVSPHTFWSYIYLNRKKFENKKIPQEVLEHELVHVRQLHSADIIFVELMQVFLWFLPLVFLLKRAVRLNHEFLADTAVLKNVQSAKSYQHILLSFSSEECNNLVNSINYQSIKKRFTVMKKQTSQQAILLRTFLILPLVAGLLYGFSSTETVYEDPAQASPEHEKNVQEKLENGVQLNSNYPGSPQEQEKATPKMIQEYNQLAKHFKRVGITEENIESREFKRMKYIFSLMTPQQKESAEKFPPPPPPIEVVGQPARVAEKVQNREDENLPPLPPPVEVTGYPAPPPPPVIDKGGEQVPPPPPPPVPTINKDGDLPDPPLPPAIDPAQVPPPPPPPSPVEAVEQWIEEGAVFFYNGKRISGKRAFEIVKKNNGINLSVQVQTTDSQKTVNLSDKL